MPKIVNTALKAKAWTFEAKATGQGHKIWPRGQGLASRTTSLPRNASSSVIDLRFEWSL